MVHGKRLFMSRFIYEECFGAIPEGYVVRHKCDHPRCINPAHLEIGTQYENVQDREQRHRTVCGAKSKNAKLTEADVLFIRNSSLKCSQLAQQFNMSYVRIWEIRKGRAWRHLLERTKHHD